MFRCWSSMQVPSLSLLEGPNDNLIHFSAHTHLYNRIWVCNRIPKKYPRKLNSYHPRCTSTPFHHFERSRHYSTTKAMRPTDLERSEGVVPLLFILAECQPHSVTSLLCQQPSNPRLDLDGVRLPVRATVWVYVSLAGQENKHEHINQVLDKKLQDLKVD